MADGDFYLCPNEEMPLKLGINSQSEQKAVAEF